MNLRPVIDVIKIVIPVEEIVRRDFVGGAYCQDILNEVDEEINVKSLKNSKEGINMTLKLSTVNLSWDGIQGSSGYDIFLDGVRVSNTGSKARTTKIGIPEGTLHSVAIIAKPSGIKQEARIEWESTLTPINENFMDRIVPFDPLSPWNIPIPINAKIHQQSVAYIQRVSSKGLPLTSDVDQYTHPVWIINDSTPKMSVTMTGWFSSYDNGDNSKKSWGEKAVITDVPIPVEAEPSLGTDGVIVLWNPKSGVLWEFNRWSRVGNEATARHGHRYYTTVGNYGRFVDGGTGARGMGTPQLAGLVRKWEIEQGHIDHALTFAYHSPSPEFWYPASKSDGGEFGGEIGIDIPEGARLQLNPNLTETDFTAYSLNVTARVIAKALQKYGMFVADNSGSSKIYLEDRKSAKWSNDVNRSMLSNIPWNQFRVLEQTV